MRLNATHGSGSSGTNVLCTIVGCRRCWAGIGPDITKIATEIRIALMLRLLHHYYGFAGLVRWLTPTVFKVRFYVAPRISRTRPSASSEYRRYPAASQLTGTKGSGA